MNKYTKPLSANSYCPKHSSTGSPCPVLQHPNKYSIYNLTIFIHILPCTSIFTINKCYSAV